jgi:hypothetical protein
MKSPVDEQVIAFVEHEEVIRKIFKNLSLWKIKTPTPPDIAMRHSTITIS